MRRTISWNVLATDYWSRDEDEVGWSKFLMKSALEFPYFYYAPPLLRGKLHVVRDTAAEGVWYCNIDDTGAR